MKVLTKFYDKKKLFSRFIHQTLEYQEYTNSWIAIRDYRYPAKVETHIDIKDLRVCDPNQYPNMSSIFALSAYPDMVEPNEVQIVDNRPFVVLKTTETHQFGVFADDLALYAKTYDRNMNDIRLWKTNKSKTIICYVSEFIRFVMVTTRKERHVQAWY